jgi:ribosomal protein L1
MSEIPELDPNIITTLIEKVVEDISDAEIDTLIAFFRKERIAVITAESQGTKAKKTNLDKAASLALAKEIKTEDLDLG